jgi:hypothetical protein
MKYRIESLVPDGSDLTNLAELPDGAVFFWNKLYYIKIADAPNSNGNCWAFNISSSRTTYVKEVETVRGPLKCEIIIYE